ncbi:MAG TPA: DinB family protein [Chitinophagaceae bacterium]|jgi:uncharacterized damage-inducible protein DinB
MKEQLLSTLENSRKYTLGVADKMPGNLYNFKPTDAVWDFRELLHHIAYGIDWWNENYIKATETAWEPPAVKGEKMEIIANLDKAYESLKGTICNLQLNDKAMLGFNATLDHITHHRGQAVLYLRCKGITPPEYTY